MSRANAQVRREAEATRPKLENSNHEIRAAVIAFVARFDCVAILKISMIGRAVGVFGAAVRSPILTRKVLEKANVKVPLRIMPAIMLRGTTMPAFTTSSPNRVYVNYTYCKRGV